METTGVDASWINGNNERHNKGINNIVRVVIINSNQHTNGWCYAAETSSGVYGWKLHSALDNTSLHLIWYVKNHSIRELKSFECDIYPITSSPKTLDNRTQEVSFMGYTNSRSTMKLWNPCTNKLKYCSSENFNEYINKFVKGW